MSLSGESRMDVDEQVSTPISSRSSLAENDLIQPVALLMDELKSEDTAIRVEAMSRLQTIALALGPDRTRNELVPFLQCSLDEEDEVLSVLIENIVGLVDHAGGPSHAHVVIPLLEGLVSTEEPYVRSAALTAYSRIIEMMPVELVVESVIPSLRRLARGDWFSEKSSAASLIVFVIQKLGSQNSDKITGDTNGHFEELLGSFEALLHEEVPLVRKAVANNLAALSTALFNLSATSHLERLVKICMQLAGDAQDSVRLLAVEPLAVLLEQSSTSCPQQFASLVPLFLALASDNSWRIRFMVATNYGHLSASLVREANVDTLGIYCTLLKDAESEVRSAACSQLSKVAALYFIDQINEHIVPSISILLTDPSSHVRASLALQLNDFARVIGAAQ